jgi:hypothetical protein
VTQFPSEDGLLPEEIPATPLRGPEKAKPPAQPAHRIALASRDPEIRSEILRSAPSNYRELSIPAAKRGPFTDKTKTLVFNLTYNDRPAAIAVTANEKGQLVNAYVGGALATVVPERVLLAKKKQRSGVGGPGRNDPLGDWEESDSAAVKTLGENLDEMKCASSAVAKSILEALGFLW